MKTALLLAAFLMLGAAVGAVHFRLLARDADLLVRGGSVGAALGVRLGRFALTIAALVLAARIGGWPALLATALGFALVRPVMVRRLGAVPVRAAAQGADAVRGPGA